MSDLKSRKSAPKVGAKALKSSAIGHIGEVAGISKWRRFNESRVDRSSGPDACHLSTYVLDGSNGYPITKFKGIRVTRAKAQWLDTNGPDSIPAGMLVLHTCNCKACLNPAHHYLGTRSQNMLDSVAAGTSGKRKLTKEDASAIFISHYRGGAKQGELAAKYGTTPENIRHILKRRTWKKATADLVALTKPKKARKPQSRKHQYELRV